jgi:hypothetical protein
VREILVSKIFRALDPDPVKKGRDSKEGGGKGREVYDKEWMHVEEREGRGKEEGKEGGKEGILTQRERHVTDTWVFCVRTVISFTCDMTRV